MERNKLFSIRIGDIEATNYYKEPDNSIRLYDSKIEVLQHFPNTYFGKENEYEYNEVTKMYVNPSNPHSFIHESCFKDANTCCVIAYFRLRRGEWEMEWVGQRPSNLNKEDQSIFMDICKLTFNHLYKEDYGGQFDPTED